MTLVEAWIALALAVWLTRGVALAVELALDGAEEMDARRRRWRRLLRVSVRRGR